MSQDKEEFGEELLLGKNNLCVSAINEASDRTEVPKEQRFGGGVLGKSKFACFFLN